MRFTFLGAVLALLLPACGGGAATTTLSAALQGTVYEVDGQSFDLAGVEVEVLETGERALTGLDGSFEFEDREPGASYTLDFDDGVHAPSEDDRDAEVDMPLDGGDVEVRVRLENGEVRDFSVGHREQRESVAHLEGEGVEGVIRLRVGEEGASYLVCAARFDAGTRLDILIDGVSVGVAVANEEGRACFDARATLDELEQLAGKRIELRLEGETILVGEVPDLPAEKEEPNEEESGEKEGDEPEGEKPSDEPEGEEKSGEESGESDGSGEGGESSEAA